MGANSVVAELVDGCNLRCILCWNRDREMPFTQMSVETAQKIVDRWGNAKNSIITWYNFGEPLLHRQFNEIARIAAPTRSYISTNFSMDISDERLKSLVCFDTVLISISGLDEATYSLYHKGGNLDKVVENIKRYAALKPTNAKLRWLKHKDNAHQLIPAEKWAKSLGFGFDSLSMNCDVEENLAGFRHPYIKRFRNKSSHSCRLLHQIVIDPDGNYLLCCQSRNVKLGPTINDNVTGRDLFDLKLKNNLCTECRTKECWRMY